MTAASRPPAPAAEGLSRRSFLTRSAAGGAGVLLSGGVTGLFGVARRPGTTCRATWVPVPDRDAASESIRNQFDEITRSRKLEGMWWGDGGAHFVASYARTEDGGVIAAEDGEGVQHLVGADERGRTFFFARNDDAEENSEFTGPNFSYDRKWLFANIQDPGIVFAFTGPWTGTR